MVIVDDPQKGISEDNLTIHDGQGKACKHLKGDTPGKFSCGIHDKYWYKETPCARHGQIERIPDTKCRMGDHVMRMRELAAVL